MHRMCRYFSLSIALLALSVGRPGSVAAQVVEKAPVYISAGQPAVECFARVNYDLFTDLPGYFVQDATRKVCVPFSWSASFAPPGYKGDYFATEFTDTRIKARYAACKKEPACNAKLAGITPLNPVPDEFRVTGAVDPAGKIDPHGTVDLRRIRRPAYFGAPQFREPIAESEARTYIIEFRVPREAYERLHMHRTDPLALRGWYIDGEGVPDETGKKRRALVVLMGGRSAETTATEASGEWPYEYDAAKGTYVSRKFPNTRSEKFGARSWRNYMYELNRAGFDVLTFDKRGHGISGGYNTVNTLEQGRDMLRALDALESGEGVRALSPAGELLAGAAVRGKFLAGMKAMQIPVVLGGSSQGSIATSWAMQQNFVEDCTYDLPEVRCSPARGYNVKGALLLATVGAGIGGRPAPVDVDAGVLDEARSRVEKNVVMLPSSEPMAHIDRWPAVFFGRGLWDFAESLEASFDAYRRAKGLKEFVVVRGPHTAADLGGENGRYMIAHTVAFARAAALGWHEVPGVMQFGDLKSLVESSPPYWEASSDPGRGR
jgi:pimeloyl-ACP methyl ester carboxylesterase